MGKLRAYHLRRENIDRINRGNHTSEQRAERFRYDTAGKILCYLADFTAAAQSVAAVMMETDHHQRGRNQHHGKQVKPSVFFQKLDKHAQSGWYRINSFSDCRFGRGQELKGMNAIRTFLEGSIPASGAVAKQPYQLAEIITLINGKSRDC